MQYQEAIDTLASLGPELRIGKALTADATTGTLAAPRKFSLEHIRTLLAELGNPHLTFPSVLIAGTNGKGSTAATLASICAAANLRTGLYTSPHLIRVNERIRVNGAEIPDADFGRHFGRVYTCAEQLTSQSRLPHLPSFFELLTATAFLFFAEQRLDIVVLEVGLGGRLDATNVVEPIVSVITDIGIDHTEFLGDTLGAIAREKAGILRPHGVLVTLSQHPEANAAIGDIAVNLSVRGVDAAGFLPPRGFTGIPNTPPPIPTINRSAEPGKTLAAHNRNELEGPAPVTHVPDLTATEAPSSRPEAEARSGDTRVLPVTLATPEPSPLGRNSYPLSLDGQILHLDSPLAGQHQQRNLALAVATAVELRTNHGFTISNAAIEAGVRNTQWPGRLEWIPSNPANPHPHAPLLLDVAHNPAGAWTLRAAIAQLPDERPRTLLFSCLADKNIREMASILFPLFDSTSGDPARHRDHIVLAPIPNPRAATVDDLLAAAHALDIPAHAAPHLAGALQQAHALTPPNGLVVVTGSVYLVGAVRALVLPEPTSASSAQPATYSAPKPESAV